MIIHKLGSLNATATLACQLDIKFKFKFRLFIEHIYYRLSTDQSAVQ